MIGMHVTHISLGKGIVTAYDEKYITVEFATKTISLQYPLAFEKFLKADDASVQATILKELAAAKEAEAAIKKAQEEQKAAIEQARKTVAITTKSKERKLEDGFGEDYNVEHLARKPILTYQQVETQFGIKISGFGRGINKTATTIVLISSIDKQKTGFVYHDHWTSDGDYIYSGEGKTGNQTLTSGNRAIINASTDNKEIHLFVKFSPQEYYYQGIFELVDYSYEDDKDEDGNMRKEYKFRLRKVD